MSVVLKIEREMMIRKNALRTDGPIDGQTDKWAYGRLDFSFVNSSFVSFKVVGLVDEALRIRTHTCSAGDSYKGLLAELVSSVRSILMLELRKLPELA